VAFEIYKRLGTQDPTRLAQIQEASQAAEEFLKANAPAPRTITVTPPALTGEKA
jgi:Flp pilus assembly protein TadG